MIPHLLALFKDGAWQPEGDLHVALRLAEAPAANLQRSTVQYSTLQYSTVQCSTAAHPAVLHVGPRQLLAGGRQHRLLQRQGPRPDEEILQQGRALVDSVLCESFEIRRVNWGKLQLSKG